jgi:hypothetical protein
MEKLVAKGKKEIRLILEDSLHQTVQTLGVTKSKKKMNRLVDKSAKRQENKENEKGKDS